MTTEEKKTHLVKAVCTQCGGKLDVDPSQEAAVCPYCGTPFIVEKAITMYNTINVNNTVNNTVHIQHGKKGIIQSAADLLDSQLEREHRAAIREKELQLEQQRIDMEKAEKRKQASKGFWTKVLWFFGWLFIFPVPLMILLNRRTDMDPKKKKYYIIGAWAAYALLMVIGRLNPSESSPSSVTPTPKPQETATEKTASSAYADSAHSTVTAGDYTIEVPEAWQPSDGSAIAEYKNNAFAFLNYLVSDVNYASDEELQNGREEIVKRLTGSKKTSAVSDVQSKTIEINGITVNRASYHSTEELDEGLNVPGKTLVYWMRNPSSGGITVLRFFESDTTQYGYNNDYRLIAGSLQLKQESAQPAPEPTPAPEQDSSFAEFKQKMDDIEAFYDSYIEFLKTYDKNDASMLLKYADMLAKYNDAAKALDAIDENTLTAEEHAYYTEVMLRITQKNLEVLQYLQ